MPFFRMFRRECFGDAELNDDTITQTVSVTQQVFSIIERELQLTGFWESIPARNKLKAEIQGAFLSQEFIKIPNLVKNREQIISRVMELAEKNNDLILYAE
jgi:type I restriction enzyme, R subunit